jgi:hypothetical protein
MLRRAPRRRRSLLALAALLALALPPARAAATSPPQIDAEPPEVPREMYLLQAGWNNRARKFFGVAQLALHTNLCERDFAGALQLAIWNSSRSFVGVAQLGVQNLASHFVGVAQLGVHNVERSLFVGALQLGVYNQADRELYTAFQAGVVNDARSFIGGAQLGALNLMQGRRDFLGPSQIGLANVIESSVYGAIGQIGLLNWVRSEGRERHYRPQLSAPLQVGVLNIARRFFGFAQVAAVTVGEDTNALFQIALFSWNDGDAAFIQLGLANLARRVTGVQIGLFNLAGRLRGIQLGLLNWVQRSSWPVVPLVNASL